MYIAYFPDNDKLLTVNNATLPINKDTIRFATEKEKKYLFDQLAKKGYSWNEESKTLEKLQEDSEPKKFDITTLVPFESKVLVRDSINSIDEYDEDFSDVWRPAIWGVYIEGNLYPFCVLGGCYFQYCIPFEGNEHLSGKTDDCDDFYKNW